MGIGTYWVRLVEGGCTSEDQFIEITQSAQPTFAFTNPSPSVCSSSSFNLNNVVSAGNYQFFNNDVARTPVADPTNVGIGTYWVRLVEGGCASEDQFIEITQSAQPTFSFTNPSPSVCSSSSFNLNLSLIHI